MSAPGPLGAAGRRFVLYSRSGCALCDEMALELAALPAAAAVPVEVRDVDADPQIRIRWGHKIPVLLLGGELVCHGRLDADEVRRALAV